MCPCRPQGMCSKPVQMYLWPKKSSTTSQQHHYRMASTSSLHGMMIITRTGSPRKCLATFPTDKGSRASNFHFAVGHAFPFVHPQFVYRFVPLSRAHCFGIGSSQQRKQITSEKKKHTSNKNITLKYLHFPPQAPLFRMACRWVWSLSQDLLVELESLQTLGWRLWRSRGNSHVWPLKVVKVPKELAIYANAFQPKTFMNIFSVPTIMTERMENILCDLWF